MAGVTSRIIEAASGKELVRVTDNSYFCAVAWSPDSKAIATGSDHNTARIIEAVSGKELARVTHDGTVTSVDWSPDGEFLATRSDDKSVRLWRVATTPQMLVNVAKLRTRCLTQEERTQYFLSAAPPTWCITGPGLEDEKDAAKWRPKWPYHSTAWRDWLIATHHGEKREFPKNTE